MQDYPFGLIVPGLPLITQFQQTDQNKYVAQIPSPANIQEIGFFINPQYQSPENGIVLYCNFPNSNEWELLGTVTQNCPTTGWATKGISNCPYVTLGVSFESSAFALNIKDAVPNDATKEIPAFKVAQDCYNYCLSFAQINGNQMLLPSNVFDKWLERFKQKFMGDPSKYLN